MFNKKCITSVVIVVMFLFITITSFIFLQTYITQLTSKIQSDIEIEETQLNDLEIAASDNETLYILKKSNLNVTYSDILINGDSCGISGNLDQSGINYIDISSCSTYNNGDIVEFALVTAMSVESKTLLLAESQVQIFEPIVPISTIEYVNSIVRAGSTFRYVYVENGLAYLAAGDTRELVIYDVSNPTSIVELGSYYDSNLYYARTIKKVGDIIYIIAEYKNTLMLLNVSDPTNIQYINHIRDDVNLDGTISFDISGNYAFIANRDINSIASVDISDFSSLSIVDTLVDNTNLIEPYSLNIKDNVAYIGTKNGETFNSIDISNPLALSLSNSLPGIKGIRDFIINDNYAYIGESTVDKATLVDISNPSSLIESSTVSDGTNLNGIRTFDIKDNFLFAGSSASGTISMIDISDPVNMYINKTISHASIADIEYLTIDGNYLYAVSDSTDTFAIFEIK